MEADLIENEIVNSMDKKKRELGVGLTEHQKSILYELIDLDENGNLEGEYKDIPAEVYHHPDCPGVSNSMLGKLDQSYNHLMAYLDKRIAQLHEPRAEVYNLNSRGEPGNLNALDFGTFFHDLVLLPELAKDQYKLWKMEIEPPSKPEATKPSRPKQPETPKFGRTKQAQADKAEWLAANQNLFDQYDEDMKAYNDSLEVYKEAQEKYHQEVEEYQKKEQEFKDSFKGKWAIHEDNWNTAQSMKDALLSNPYYQVLTKDAEFEVTFFKRCPTTGVLRKCRTDILVRSRGFIIDLKSTADAAFNGFRKSMANFNYDKQGAYYTDIVSQVLGTPIKFIFAPVEKVEPFGVCLYNMVDPVYDVGKELYMDNLKYLKECQNNESIHGYPKEIQDIDLPAWAYDIQSRKRL